MTKDEIKLLKYKAVEAMDELIVFLDLDLTDRGEYLSGICPIHLGNNRTGFSIKKEDFTWRCWTKNCHQNCGSDVIGLIRAIKRVQFPEAINILKDFLDNKNTISDSMILEKIENHQFFKATVKEEICDFKEEFFAALTSHPYPLNRGFSREVLNHFNVGFCGDPASDFYNYLIFPVRDVKGKRVGFSCRSVLPNIEKELRWKHEGKLHRHIFGLRQALPYIDEFRSVIVVEGPLKVMRLWQAGIRNCVCIFGTSLSEEQHSSLLSSGAFTIILGMDNDESGQKARGRIKEKLLQFFYVKDLEFPWPDVDKTPVPELVAWLQENEICKSLLKSELPVTEKLVTQ